MNSYTVDILNERGRKKLRELEDRNWILLRKGSSDGFLKALQAFRAISAKGKPTMRTITGEVEKVRRKMYAQKKVKGRS